MTDKTLQTRAEMSPMRPPPPSRPPPRNKAGNDSHDEPRRVVSEDSNTEEASATASSVRTTENKQDAMAYLLRYETMVRQQEAEDMAVIAHIRPCVEKIYELLGMNELPDDFLGAEISFEHLKLAVQILTDDSRTDFCFKTDRQLMMVLTLLTQKVNLKQQETNATLSTNISWAEIVQCYKICISGMLTLQKLESHIKLRARDRTLSMLSLFEPPSTQIFHEDSLCGLSIMETSSTTTRRRGSFNNNKSSNRKRITKRRKQRRAAGLGVAMILAMAIYYFGYVEHDNNNNVDSLFLNAARKSRAALPTPTNILFSPERTTTTPKPTVPETTKHVERNQQDYSSTAISTYVYYDDYEIRTEHTTGKVATIVIGVYLVAGAPIATVTMATAAIGFGIKEIITNWMVKN